MAKMFLSCLLLAELLQKQSGLVGVCLSFCLSAAVAGEEPVADSKFRNCCLQSLIVWQKKKYFYSSELFQREFFYVSPNFSILSSPGSALNPREALSSGH